jgi:predicted permease
VIRRNVRRWFHLALRRRDRWEREVEDEIKLHLALRAEQLMSRGASADDAYEEAVRRFGSLDESRARLLDAARHREQTMERTEYFSDVRADIAFAFRTMMRQKAWTAVTMITLALGIGATTAVFSVISSLILNPLPYPNSRRIVFVDRQPSQGNNTGMSINISTDGALARAWRRDSRSFESLEGFKWSSTTMATAGDPSSVDAALVLPTFFAFAEQRPLLGRMFSEADIDAGGRVVLLGESFWRTRFAADPSVLGKAITLKDSMYTIIGVMPASLRYPSIAAEVLDLWLPLNIKNDKEGMSFIGRLRPGVAPRVAATELDSVFARSSGFSKAKQAIPFVTRISSPGDTVSFRESLIILSVAVGFVLLVACANVAHLLLARSATRQREMAVRAALGAGRGRLFRQLLTESLLLSLGGSALGVAVGWLGLRALVAMRPPTVSELAAAHLDATTLATAIALAIVTGIAFGVLGALQSTRNSTHDALKASATNTSGSRLQTRGRAMLVVSEMALSAALVVTATMLVRSVIKMQNADLGFQPRSLYSVELRTPETRYATAASRAALVSEVLARAEHLPGIRGLTAAGAAPGMRNFSIGRLEIEGKEPPPANSSSFIDVNNVLPSYFTVTGMRMIEGTSFTDTTSAARQIVINAAFARKHWPNASALGHRLRIVRSKNEPWSTVVGVVGDAATSGAAMESAAPFIYSPLGSANDAVSVLARVDGDAKRVTPIHDIAKQIDPKLPAPIKSAEEVVSRSISGPRFVMVLLTVFTSLALVLAAVGMYGVMTYTVTQKTREIGIRVALGAPSGRIARSVLVSGAVLAVVGSVIGLSFAAWGTKLIESQLYGVARSDVISFAAAVVVLVGAALLACVVPMRRALSVDPITAIRAD